METGWYECRVSMKPCKPGMLRQNAIGGFDSLCVCHDVPVVFRPARVEAIPFDAEHASHPSLVTGRKCLTTLRDTDTPCLCGQIVWRLKSGATMDSLPVASDAQP